MTAEKKKKVKTSGKGLAYSEDSIKVLEGLDKVRSNASMYMGDLGPPMIYRMVKEAVDNFTDEYQAGRNKRGIVSFSLKKNQYVIADFAEGIPVGIKKVGGKSMSTLTVVLTELHAGGKFDASAYETSGGTHGVGISATNALSSEFRVWTHREGSWYHQAFECGKALHDVKKLSGTKDIAKRFPWLAKHVKKLGTIIEFIPDQTVVSVDASRTKNTKKTKYTTAQMDWRAAGEWLNNVAMLNPGLEITFHDIDRDKSKTFLNKVGLMGLVDKAIEERELSMLNARAKLEFKSKNIDLAFTWTSHPDVDLFNSFVNSSPTIDHGTHVKGLRDAMMDGLKPHFPKKAMKDFKADDIFIGFVCFFNWKMNSASFSGQVKDKLVSKVDNEIYDQLAKPIKAFFDKNKALAKAIIKQAEAAGKMRGELQKIMKSMSDVRKSTRNMLPDALDEAPNCKPSEREIYIVEGDSAGGTAKNARNTNQEVLRLSGKIPNAFNTTLPKLLANKRIQDIICSLGADPKTLDVKADNPTFSCDSMRAARVILLSDADPDGSHINSLLIAFFWRLFPDMIKTGRLFVVDAPLYNAMHKGKHYGGHTIAECLAAMKKDKVPANLMFRAKGWGEVGPDLLDPMAFNPASRKLIRINTEACSKRMSFYRAFVGEDAAARRRLLGIKA